MHCKTRKSSKLLSLSLSLSLSLMYTHFPPFLNNQYKGTQGFSPSLLPSPVNCQLALVFTFFSHKILISSVSTSWDNYLLSISSTFHLLLNLTGRNTFFSRLKLHNSLLSTIIYNSFQWLYQLIKKMMTRGFFCRKIWGNCRTKPLWNVKAAFFSRYIKMGRQHFL